MKQLALVLLKVEREELRTALYAVTNCAAARKLLLATSRGENSELSGETELVYLAMRACFKEAAQRPSVYTHVLELYDVICDGKSACCNNNFMDELTAMALIARVSTDFAVDVEKWAIPLLDMLISAGQSWEDDALRAAALTTCLATGSSNRVKLVFHDLALTVDEVCSIM